MVTPRSPEDVDAMRLVLLMKLNEHPELLRALLTTEDRCIIEDCSARPSDAALFWGAARDPGAHDTWRGQNQLGLLWMRIRADRRAAAAR